VTVEIALGFCITRVLELALGFWEAVPDPVFFRVLGFCFTLRAFANNAQINNLGHRRTQCLACTGQKRLSAVSGPQDHFGQMTGRGKTRLGD
jgi:hypothetical protein